MAKFPKAAPAIAVGACGLLGTSAASTNSAAIFVHGTSDYQSGVSFLITRAPIPIPKLKT